MAIGSAQWMYASGEAYELEQSLRFSGDAGGEPKLTFTPSSNPTSNKQHTVSFWVKRGELEAYSAVISAGGRFDTGVYFNGGANNKDTVTVMTNYAEVGRAIEIDAVLRDVSAWYHIVATWDTNNSTATDRHICWVNGVRQAVGSEATMPQNGSTKLMANGEEITIGMGGRYQHENRFDGCLAEFHCIDGQVLTPTSFGETGDYGEWKPIEYSGTYGNNGFYLDFSNSSALGDDKSGNNNDFAVNAAITASDQILDTPTNNFATLNLLWQDSSITLQEGNLRSSRNANMNRPSFSTISLGTGKWYFEALDQYTTGNQIGVEWEGEDVETYVHNSGTKAYTWNSSGSTYAEGSYGGGGSGGSVASGARIRMVAYDGATGKLWGGANGTWGSSGNPAAGTNESMTVPAAYRDKMHFVVATENSSTSQGIVANFGQDSSFAGLKTAQGNQDGNNIGDFYYTPPTGFLALCTKNLPDVAVTPSEHFNTVLYNGSASTPLAVTGVGFSPDMTWLKARSTGWGTGAFTRLNGTGAGSGYKYMFTNTTAAESDLWGAITFDSDGFTGVSSGHNGSFAHDFGGNGQTFVSWNWKANGSGSSNTNGNITSTVSANVDAGFSIVSYTGNQTASATVGHGLSKAPEMVIIKNRDAAGYGWLVGHDAITWEKYVVLNTTAATTTEDVFNDTAPTASVFSPGGTTFGNKTGDDIIAYCFHSVDGYSKVGSYEGNASNATEGLDGTFVYTGFRPAWVMCKLTTLAGESWLIKDSERSPYNPADEWLYADQSAAESTASTALRDIDFLSNGFKFKGHSTELNGDGHTYIYIAFAETPFKYSNAR